MTPHPRIHTLSYPILISTNSIFISFPFRHNWSRGSPPRIPKPLKPASELLRFGFRTGLTTRAGLVYSVPQLGDSDGYTQKSWNTQGTGRSLFLFTWEPSWVRTRWGSLEPHNPFESTLTSTLLAFRQLLAPVFYTSVSELSDHRGLILFWLTQQPKELSLSHCYNGQKETNEPRGHNKNPC